VGIGTRDALSFDILQASSPSKSLFLSYVPGHFILLLLLLLIVVKVHIIIIAALFTHFLVLLLYFIFLVLFREDIIEPRGDLQSKRLLNYTRR
jgi:hypothetical protein